MRALGQCALQNSRNVSFALSEVRRMTRFEKSCVQRRDHANSVQKFHERNAIFIKISGILATAQKFIHLGQHALFKRHTLGNKLSVRAN